MIPQIIQSKTNIFVLSLHFVILYRHQCLFIVFICLDSALKIIKTKNINQLSHRPRRAVRVDCTICGANVGLKKILLFE